MTSASSTLAAASMAAKAKVGILKPSKFAVAATTGLNAPLIPREEPEDDPGGGDGDASAPGGMSQNDATSVAGAALLAAAGLAAAVAAVVTFPSAAVILMGAVCAVSAPVMGKNQLDLAKSAGVRRSVNMIREETGYLKIEVDFLEMTVNELQEEANTLKGLESRLQTIAEEQGTNVDSLVELVNENQSILGQMKNNLKQKFAAAVANIVIRSDTDGDMKIDLKELPLLSMRLKTHLEEMGVELDVGMFEAMIREDNDISNAIKFCADILDEDEGGDDDDKSVESEGTFDLEAFAQTLDEEGNLTNQKLTKKDRLTMIRVTDKYTKGSVEVARGGRPTFAKQSHCTHERKTLRKTKVKAVKKRQTQMKAKSRENRLTMGGLVHIRGTSAEI